MHKVKILNPPNLDGNTNESLENTKVKEEIWKLVQFFIL